MSQLSVEEARALLARLPQKPGIRCTLVLSRKKEDAIIYWTTGLRSQSTTSASENGAPEEYSSGRRVLGAEKVAKLVWEFMDASDTLVQGLDDEKDEAELLRVRAKKHEFLIVPHPKYLLVAIHETPSSS
ncbi:hypothetical protein M501DRAFT_1015958 [Patellaria atrata CBS 101060]|uniref:Roadblock/LAMTOR2 domain-containing protein n=1 Tax=Patellaria atrata CBS 101060 TaxID=1346257 RepID=A0A9P4SC00_9PEZI|nr:hypothetical protein M501DRAFT_1015958 [Patellaria atrata CBS 101060]